MNEMFEPSVKRRRKKKVHHDSDVSLSLTPTSNSMQINTSYKPNDLLLRDLQSVNANVSPNDPGLQHMTEHSYSDFNDCHAEYKQQIIRDMIKSVQREVATFVNNDTSTEFRPYEQQTQFTTSLFGRSRNLLIAENIRSKYNT